MLIIVKKIELGLIFSLKYSGWQMGKKSIKTSAPLHEGSEQEEPAKNVSKPSFELNLVKKKKKKKKRQQQQQHAVLARKERDKNWGQR